MNAARCAVDERLWRILWEVLPMIPFIPGTFIHLLTTLDHLGERAARIVDDPSLRGMAAQSAVIYDQSIPESVIPGLKSTLEICENYSKLLGLEATEIASKLLLQRIVGKTLSKHELRSRAVELRATVLEELERQTFFQVLRQNKNYLNQERPFGESVWTNYPSARVDLSEAGNCLAMHRGTACVFHLMRAMEVALKVLAKGMGIPYAPSWEAYITQLNNKIAAKHATKSAKWKKDQPFYIEVLGDLQSIKISWRNPTMHIVRQYSPEEAADIYSAVKRFVSRLSDKLSEAKPRKTNP
jgi:hypothetical protein